VEIGLFASVRGLEVTSNTEEILEGGQNGYVHRVPGRLQWPNIVFSRGLTQADALFDWMNKTSGEGFASAGNKVTRCTGAITVIMPDGARLRSWSLADVLPVRWKGPDFDVANSTPLSEELEITHHGFRSTQPSGAG
jgi:phage tail-like protein